MIEIERKFIVKNQSFKEEIHTKSIVSQGYLSSNPERTVRVRMKNEKGYLTIKGISNESGTSRYEWEKEIPLNEAVELFKLCEKGAIEKTRHEIKYGNHTYEVDEFHGDNEGLIIAEIELSSENEKFDKPNWLGDEVTGEQRYYNSNLSILPFKEW
ncbi:Inorganic triphosphatase [Flavobacterium sp. CECT 9288]|uniref:CYTH domain-containing protein n=1 Tax=Flavobacterium sp. CECT 9288 TaxID=2845819 RepID=UPI001E5948FC|nr:CYTH domain-containing protein [Flavobacterium sp. CECT 9288]CAH0337243.1 Inorganic triphosphatase [Flavobacterium sp. CECT 9288]